MMIQVYIADIANLPDPMQNPSLMEGLSKHRKEKIMRHKMEKDRKQSLGAGLLLREVLLRHGVVGRKMTYGENGKPQMEGFYFNLSHSDGMVLCAAGDSEVGCDVEKIKREPRGLVRHFFCDSEIAYLEQFCGADREREFFRLWTMKESYMKMTGEGMRLSLKQFELILGDKVSVRRAGHDVSCFFREYEIPGYRGCVCAREKNFSEQIEYICIPALKTV